ncbi:MAG: hypothetical protein Kow0062_10750 [Acidobacteriota bacterium]
MAFMICRNRVRDFDRWKRVFDSHAEAHRAAGLRLRGMWRGIEQPDQVFFLFEVDDVERARAFVTDPASARAGEEAGVLDGELHFVERLGSG